MENDYDRDDALINNHAALIEDAVNLVWHFYDKCYKEACNYFGDYHDGLKVEEIAMMAAVAALQDYKQEVKEMTGR